MRIFPLVTAILVSAALYLMVFERDRLIAFAAGDAAAPGGADTATQPPATPSPIAAQATGTERQVRVKALHSVARTIDSAVVARGRTEAARQVEVKAETSGLVVSEPLRRGTYVTAGQDLCRLDEGTRGSALAEAEARLNEARTRLPEAQARLAEARSKLVEAEINDRAASRLSEGGFASETRVAATGAMVETARAGVSSAESGVQAAASTIAASDAAVAAARNEIAKITMAAPFDGLLETDTAELGALLQPGAPCATIIQLDPVKLVGYLSEADVDKVTVGAIAGARLVAGREVQGRVTFLSRSSDPLTRTFRVEVTVPNADLSIRDGQTAEMLIASDGRKAHLLPGSALTLDDAGTLGVRVVGPESRALFRAVTLLRDTAEGVWVTGLDEAMDVIVLGQEFVTDGVAVDPVFDTAAAGKKP